MAGSCPSCKERENERRRKKKRNGAEIPGIFEDSTARSIKESERTCKKELRKGTKEKAVIHRTGTTEERNRGKKNPGTTGTQIP
jgi:hypothetical protein